MQLQSLQRDSLQQILTRLDQALYNHQQWHSNLMRTLTCRLPCDQHDISTESHKECRFGQWYYSQNSKPLTEHAGFIAIGDAHQYMHGITRQILLSLDHTNIITPQDYDKFSNSLERLTLEIGALKTELENLLYYRDPLTMAINRASMLPMLREQQDLVRRQSQRCCIAMMDLDNFKNVNDQYGHTVGDKVLAELSHFVMKHLRDYDKLFRYGGEEFLLCLQQADVKQISKSLNLLREKIASHPFNVGLKEPLFITVSLGLTTLDPDTTVEQAIDHSDKALYHAKNSGKNRLEVWSEKTA